MTADKPENPTEELAIVQLTRMEGKLDRVFDRVDDVRDRVEDVRTVVARHDVEIGQLQSLTQSLKEGAVAEEKKAVALALGLKEAKEATEAAARNEAAKAAAAAADAESKAALGWAPITKLFAGIAAVAVAVPLYQALINR